MLFKDLELNIEYNSDSIDVTKDFFIPVLRIAKSYRRVSAYYSSTSLKLIAEGLASMISNDGDMKLLVSYLVSEEDFDAVLSAKKRPEEILNSINIDNETKLQELMVDENVRALGYLIAAGRLDIKFVICRSKGLFHLKFGIFTDSIGDKISFSGSINETYEGLTDNIEEFKVFRSWVPDERKYLESDSDYFDKFWNGRIKKKDYLVVEMPEKIRNTITKAYRESEKHIRKSIKPLPPLWNHQQTAVDKWIENNHSGIIEMATGTGKTIVAISCIKEMARNHQDNLLIVIGCPTQILVSQWADNLKNYASDLDLIIVSEQTKDSIYRPVVNSNEAHQIIIGAYASLSKGWFTDVIIPKYKGKIMFIADEAHWLGAKKLSKALSADYGYRLGLTATPIRYFDIEGTDRLLNYFKHDNKKDVIFKYTLKQAIRDDWLCPYNYHMFFAYLDKDETEEYLKLTKKYAKSFFIGKNRQLDDEHLTVILAERAKIVKKSSDKVNKIREILQKLKDENKLSSLLIYFEDDDHISNYLDMMDEFNIEYRRIDGDTKDKDRELILNDLSENKIDCVIAMKVLDEGVDVKKLSRAILVSSSGNPKQFIQRRGRILRKAPGKKIADIYDVCVLADTKNQRDKKFNEIEEKIMTGEFKRLAIFSMSAHNKADCYKELEKISKDLNIDIFSIINDVRKYDGE